MPKKANNLGKIGGSHDFQSKWIAFNAKKAKNLGKIGGSKWINFNAKKGKKFGQIQDFSNGCIHNFQI